jgi:hypothetical protein
MAPAGMGNSYLWADYRAVAEAEVESHHSVNAAIAWVASVRGEGPSLFGRLSKLPVGEINRVDRGSGLFLVGFICIRRRIPKHREWRTVYGPRRDDSNDYVDGTGEAADFPAAGAA